MAYGYYNPYFNPYNPTQTMQPTQQPVSQVSQGQSILWVNGYNEAANYPVAPNAAVALWDTTLPCIYLKKADASGKPVITVYDLVERRETPKATDDKFVTEERINALTADFEAKLNALREELTPKKKEAKKDG